VVSQLSSAEMRTPNASQGASGMVLAGFIGVTNACSSRGVASAFKQRH
jgi:hypothetical protein